MSEQQDDVVAKIQEELRELSLYLHNELYLQIYNKTKSFLEASGTFQKMPQIEGITRDEFKSAAAYRIVENLIFSPLVPVYLFKDRPFDCVRWVKGNLKGLSPNFAEFILSCQKMVLQENFSQEGSHVNVIINELNSFSYAQSDDTPIHKVGSWIQFFTGGAAFIGREGNPLEEVIKADFAVRGYLATPEDELGAMMRKHPAAALKIVQELIPFQGQPSKQVDKSTDEPDSTMPRQVLALHYLLKLAKVDVDASIKARFIKFLTGKSYKNIYDQVRNPLAKKDGKLRVKDLQEVRKWFEDLELTEIVEMINKELEVTDK